MESAIFGLVGVALGALLAVAKEWWFQNRKNRKEAEYLAIQISCELEWYAIRCAEVVGDDGLCHGERDENDGRKRQVKAPKFDPMSFNVEWKALPVKLMYEILDFPYKAEIADHDISSTFDYDDQPDYERGFEERQFQYASLGIAASQLATKLRKHVGIPERERTVDDWDPVQDMKERRSAIELRRAESAARASASLTLPGVPSLMPKGVEPRKSIGSI